jgi:4-amino-4-deoxy-L-arabinose transferase-like glycosyltransferase
MLIYVIIAAIFVWLSRKTKTKNEIYLYTFYMAVAIAGLSKGLIAALQPGFIILIYIFCSREWRMLTEVALCRGIMVAICLFFPWFHGMVAKYGVAFWNELFGTEQFRRLTIGEQAQAVGTFEYYISQIGYGLFPWVAFLPAALMNNLIVPKPEQDSRTRAKLFSAFWLVAVMCLFGITKTKYHPYILPIIPPAAILIAIYLDDLLAGKVRGLIISLLAAFGILAMVTFDLVKEPARWVWMYTYLYDRTWAAGVPKGMPILIYGVFVGVALLLLFIPKLRRAGVWAMVLVTVIGGGLVLNWYQLSVAPHWSQKKAIATYYKLRKSPQEELIAWQFNWRGETWYTAAEVVVAMSLNNTAIIKYMNERPNRRFFFITERSRYPSLRSILPTEKGRKTLKIVDDTNIHYVLAAADI